MFQKINAMSSYPRTPRTSDFGRMAIQCTGTSRSMSSFYLWFWMYAIENLPFCLDILPIAVSLYENNLCGTDKRFIVSQSFLDLNENKLIFVPNDVNAGNATKSFTRLIRCDNWWSLNPSKLWLIPSNHFL